MPTVVNGALDAAMNALKAQPYPWFLPAYSIRLTDFAVYTSLVQFYGFGSPLIIGLSPTAAAALTGVAINQVTTYAAQTVNPQIFVHPSAQNVLGTTVSLSDSGGTIMVPYSTPAGRFDRVVWEWQCDVEFNPTPVAIDAGTYEQQVVQWTGDDSSARLIPTSFSLASGVVAVWICGGVGAVSDVNCFRHNNPTMGGTQIMGAGLPPQTTTGIMTFTSAGFTVTKGSVFGNTYANGTGKKYSAIVMRDTTADNRYLRVGSYSGVSGLSLAVHMATFGMPTTITAVGPSVLLPEYAGMTFTDSTQGTGTYTLAYDASSGTFTLGAQYRGAGAPTNISLTYGANPRNVTTLGKASTLTHLWIWGRGVTYRSNDFTGDSSVSLAVEAYPVTDVIKSMGAATFTVGTQNNVNNALTPYDYVALSVDAAFTAQHIFASFKGTGTASPPLVVTGLGLTPVLAFGRQYTINSTGGIWRGLDHTGTDSAFCAAAAGFNDEPTLGITAMASDTVSFQTDLAPNGVDTYGWAFVTGTVPASGTAAPYTGIAAAAGEYVPDGSMLIAGGGGFTCHCDGSCGCGC